MYDKLKEHCDQIYLAGDDDQAIYAWAGADVKRFVQEPAKERILRQSRRISMSVQGEANTGLISSFYPKGTATAPSTGTIFVPRAPASRLRNATLCGAWFHSAPPGMT